MKNLKDKIKEKIKKEKPNPKWQYTTNEILKNLILIILWISIVIGIGAFTYILIHYNPWTKVPYAFKYFWNNLFGLPWEFMIILGILIIISYYLVKKIHFIYRLNRWLIVGIILLSLILGYFIAEKIGINQKIANIELIRKIYQSQGKLIQTKRTAIVIGLITEIDKEKLTIKDTAGYNWSVVIDKNTIFPQGSKFFLGEIVKIQGITNKNSINAIIMQPLNIKLRGYRKINYNPNCNDLKL